MDTETRILIIEELTKYLNRPPTEKEIGNSITDINIMGKVKEKQNESKVKLLQEEITKLKK